MTPEPDPPDLAYEGHSRTAPPNLTPWMYNCWYPPTSPSTHSNKGTGIHTDMRHTHTLSLKTSGFSWLPHTHCKYIPATAMHHYYDIWQWWSILLLHVSIWIYDDLFMQLLVTSFLSSLTNATLHCGYSYLFSSTFWLVVINTLHYHCQTDCRSAGVIFFHV